MKRPRMRRVLCVLSVVAITTSAAAHAQSASAARTTVEIVQPSGSLLDRLVGEWRMSGHVGRNPVAYTLSARRVLGGRYVELHMVDASTPPTYEARVFVGEDTIPGRVLVHWLDTFGAAFSVPAATGTLSGDTLRFEFAYSSGPFRDTFGFHPSTRRWTFRLESGTVAGAWRPFAEYEVRQSADADGAVKR